MLWQTTGLHLASRVVTSAVAHIAEEGAAKGFVATELRASFQAPPPPGDLSAIEGRRSSLTEFVRNHLGLRQCQTVGKFVARILLYVLISCL